MEKGKDLQSWIFETFLLISRMISPLHRSQSLRFVTLLAILGLLSPFCRSPMPMSLAWVSRNRYSIDCAFSEFRDIVRDEWGVVGGCEIRESGIIMQSLVERVERLFNLFDPPDNRLAHPPGE